MEKIVKCGIMRQAARMNLRCPFDLWTRGAPALQLRKRCHFGQADENIAWYALKNGVGEGSPITSPLDTIWVDVMNLRCACEYLAGTTAVDHSHQEPVCGHFSPSQSLKSPCTAQMNAETRLSPSSRSVKLLLVPGGVP